MIINRLARAMEVLERNTPTVQALEGFSESDRERFAVNFAAALDLAKAPLAADEFESLLMDLLND